MEEIILYSTHCPKCMVLEKKLTEMNVDFILIDDEDEVVRVGEENNIMSAPFIKINNEYKDFNSAIKWIRNEVNK